MSAGTPKLVMRFDQRGGVKIDAQCFTGAACTEATKAMELALQGQVTADRRKDEYYDNAENNSATVDQTLRM